jgi:hypothetical protein
VSTGPIFLVHLPEDFKKLVHQPDCEAINIYFLLYVPVGSDIYWYWCLSEVCGLLEYLIFLINPDGLLL